MPAAGNNHEVRGYDLLVPVVADLGRERVHDVLGQNGRPGDVRVWHVLVAVARDVQERAAQRLLGALYAGHVEQAHAVASECVEQVPTVCRTSALHHVREHLDYADMGDAAFHGEPLSHFAAHRPAAYHGDAARLAEKLRLTEQTRGGHGQVGIDEPG